MTRRRLGLLLAAAVAAVFIVAPFASAHDEPPAEDATASTSAEPTTEPTTETAAPAEIAEEDSGSLGSVTIPSGLPQVPGVPVLSGPVPIPNPLEQDSDAQNGTVELGPNAGSGISGSLTIEGTAVTGTATGLDPTARYITLYYGSQSTAEPNQTLTCADARTAVAPRDWGTSPEWTVGEDGAGALDATAPRLIGDAPKPYTASIRQVPDNAGDDPYDLFNPLQYPVVACGAIVTQR